MSLVYISGNVGGASNATICANCADRFQRVVVRIPAHKKLKLKKVMYYLTPVDNLRLQIENHPYGDAWVSASNSGAESPNYMLWENTGNKPFDLGISILIRNTLDNVDHTVLPEAGWSIVLSVE